MSNKDPEETWQTPQWVTRHDTRTRDPHINPPYADRQGWGQRPIPRIDASEVRAREAELRDSIEWTQTQAQGIHRFEGRLRHRDGTYDAVSFEIADVELRNAHGINPIARRRADAERTLTEAAMFREAQLAIDQQQGEQLDRSAAIVGVARSSASAGVTFEMDVMFQAVTWSRAILRFEVASIGELQVGDVAAIGEGGRLIHADADGIARPAIGRVVRLEGAYADVETSQQPQQSQAKRVCRRRNVRRLWRMGRGRLQADTVIALALRYGAAARKRDLRAIDGRVTLIPNRHDVKRWSSSVRPSFAVASDLMEGGERGRAIGVLLEAGLHVEDAIEVTRNGGFARELQVSLVDPELRPCRGCGGRFHAPTELTELQHARNDGTYERFAACRRCVPTFFCSRCNAFVMPMEQYLSLDSDEHICADCNAREGRRA